MLIPNTLTYQLHLPSEDRVLVTAALFTVHWSSSLIGKVIMENLIEGNLLLKT